MRPASQLFESREDPDVGFWRRCYGGKSRGKRLLTWLIYLAVLCSLEGVASVT